jgi:hypothetical protein
VDAFSRERDSRCGRAGAEGHYSTSVRARFADLVERQLELFRQEHGGLIRDCEAALAAYNRASREDAEERYGDYLDLVDTGREALVEYRDAYARTLDEEVAEDYAEAFNLLVRKRLPRFGLELD